MIVSERIALLLFYLAEGSFMYVVQFPVWIYYISAFLYFIFHLTSHSLKLYL